MEEDSEFSPCPLCPSSIPPVPPPRVQNTSTSTSTETSSDHTQTESDENAILSWICCSKCSEWYHGICILTNSVETRRTVPQPVSEYVEKQPMGDWTDWTRWVGRWFCHICTAHSIDPANPHRPHHPLASTVDSRTFPPKPKAIRVPRNSVKRSSSSLPVDGEVSADGASVKKQKLEDGAMRNEETKEEHTSTPIKAEEPPDHLPSPATMDSPAPEGMVKDDTSAARPKRQAAKNRPDYHALHHHIATPTARWLDLIHDPAKYNTEIKDGNFPRVPASLLTRSWLESEQPEAGPSHSQPMGIPPTPPSDPSSSNRSSADHPVLSPSLYYGPLREPLIIKPEDGGFEGMEGKLPGRDLTVSDVARLVGPDRTVDVIDVATQQSSVWTLQKWAEYVSQRFGQSSIPETGPLSKVYNVISLEITGTDLGNKVRPPKIVSEIDWVDNCWNFGPGGKEAAMQEEARAAKASARDGKEGTNGDAKGASKKEKGKAREPWPKVQLYCLMGAKGSWTDWHCDFAASSVYYTIHTGAKTFFFIRPTAKNLAAYAQWSGSYEKQQTVWLGDMCDEVRKVELKQGDTMMIPAGYIHSVYTPEDSIVFGGNFLHSYDIPTQLRLRQIEIDTKVPQRFRYPYFDKLCWYVAYHYCNILRSLRSYKPRMAASAESLPCRRVLEGLRTLAEFLIQQCDKMENPSVEEKWRKLVYDRIPDAVKDAPALSRELKWRVQRELPEGSRSNEGDEIDGMDTDMPRKEVDLRLGVKKQSYGAPSHKGKSRTWYFEPPAWKTLILPAKESVVIGPVDRPDGVRLSENKASETATRTVIHRETVKTRMYPLPNGGLRQDREVWTVEEMSTEWEGSAAPVSKAEESEPTGQATCVD